MEVKSWKKQILVLWLGQFLLITATSMSTPFWPLFLAQLHTNKNLLSLWSAAMYCAPLLTAIVSTPLWAKLGTKVGHKKMIIRAIISICITQYLISLNTNPFIIVVLRLFQGFFSGFIGSAQIYAITITPIAFWGRVIGNLQSATSIGTLSGAFLGSLIANYYSYHKIFVISAIVSFLVLLYLMFFLKEDITKLKNLLSNSKEQITASSNHKSSNSPKRNVIYFLFIIMNVQVATFMITPFFALFITEQLKGNAFDIALLYAATGVTIFLSAPCWGYLLDKLIKNKNLVNYVLLIILLAASIIQMIIARSVNLHLVLVLRLLWGICLGGILPMLYVLLAHASGKTLITSFAQSANKLGQLIGIPLGAFLQSIFSFTFTINVIAFIYLLLGLILLGAKTFSLNKNVNDNQEVILMD